MKGRDTPCILAIDIGTSSVRAGLYDLAGQLRPGGLVRLGWRLEGPEPGVAEINPVRLVRQVAGAIDRALAIAHARRDRVLAVGTCCIWHSLVAADAQRRALAPVITWADTRPTAHAARLTDPAGLHQQTGCPAHASYWPAKLLWLRERDAGLFAQARWWLSPADYLYAQLFGQCVTGFGLASGTGLFDRRRGQWVQPLCAQVGVEPAQLGRLTRLDEPLQGLRGRWKRRWPMLAEVPWTVAIADGAASNVGCGCVGPGQGALMVGTSAAARVAQGPVDDVLPAALWGYLIEQGRPLTGGALSDGGAVFAWLGHTLRLPRDFEVRLAGLAPGSHGLGVLPLLSGERTPHWRADVRGVVAGLSRATGPLQIAQATMEAVAINCADMVERLDQAVGGLGRLVGTGEAMRASPLWPQMVADALGWPLELSAVPEASLRGTALLTAEALGLAPTADWPEPRIERVVEPDPAAHEAYRRIRQRNDELYRRHYESG